MKNLRRWRHRNCLSDGTLRTVVENGVDHIPEVAVHLRSCSQCRERMELIAGNAAFVTRRLESLAVESAPVDLNRARLKMQGEIERTSHETMELQGETFVSTMWKQRALRGAVAMLALVLLTTAFVSTPMRSLAGDLFNRQYEVEKFEAITVGMDDFEVFQSELLMQALSADPVELMAAAENLVEFDTTFDQANLEGNGVHLDTFDDARAAYGDFKAPGALPEGYNDSPSIVMSQAGATTLTVDTASVQTIVDELNLNINALPSASEMPQIVFRFDVPSALVMHYQANSDGHIVVGQLDSPILSTPEGVDMDALRDDVLTMPGLSDNLVDQLKAIEEWESTLVIPVPEGAETRDVTIGDEPGLVLNASSFDGSQWGMDVALDGDVSVVVWSEDGKLYVVAGTLSADEIVAVAESMR